MNRRPRAAFLILLCGWVCLSTCVRAETQRIWLTCASSDLTRVTVNWETSAPLDATLDWGTSEALGKTSPTLKGQTRHAVELEPPAFGPWFYRVRSGTNASSVIRVPGIDPQAFRAAVIADTGYSSDNWARAVLRLRPALLLAAGDLVPTLARSESESAAPHELDAFRRFIDRAPEVFRSTPFVAALGNHDRQLRPRGSSPPAEPVYDPDARAFREFFAFPGDEWHWTLDVPGFDVRFVAVDLNHTSDTGNTWQTCHDFGAGSVQLEWYQRILRESPHAYVITLYNEQHSAVRNLAGGAWWPDIRRGSAAVTGFGYFAERAEPDGFPCFNTSVSGKGARYPDAASKFLRSEDNLLLLTFPRTGPARAELQSLAGKVLDSRELPRRVPSAAPKR
jgi:hypothetical protein